MRALVLTSAMVLVLLAGGCSTSRIAGPGVYYDDIYYVPGVTRESMDDAFSPVPQLTREEEKSQQRELAAMQREYERSERGSAQQDRRDFSGIQEEYAGILNDENIESTDTLLYYNDETGYWVDGFQGSSMDRDYAERLVRFHSPAVRIPYHSPFYSEVVYYNHYDWNVYVDGGYAYAFPTWTNRWYDYYYYNSWHRPYNYYYGWNYGWNYPYSNWGFGFGWNYYSPYYAYNHWGSPYYHGYYGHRPYYNRYNHHHYAGAYRPGSTSPVVRSPRQGLSGDRSMSEAGSGQNVQGVATTNTGQVRSQSSRRDTEVSTRTSSTVAQNGDRTVLRSVNRPGEETIKSSTTQSSAPSRSGTSTRNSYSEDAPTRRSYTPSYSQTESNSRPAYNRAGYTRVSNSPRPTQTTGTVQPRTSGSTGTTGGTVRTAPTRSTTQPATTRPSAPTNYQRGSSTAPSRSSNTYSAPARSSSPSRSYSTPSRSSAPSRSYSAPSSSGRSGSSYTPSSSGGSSRSSGSNSGSSSGSSRSSSSGRGR